MASNLRSPIALLFLLLLPIAVAQRVPIPPKPKPIGPPKNRPGGFNSATTNYVMLIPVAGTGQERALCLARGRCFLTLLRCPKECPERKPKNNNNIKGCFIDCSDRCETTCKRRIPNCNGYGSICYDPRFVGGDGVMFYFHGAKNRDFALVSDDHLQINGHFIGTRPIHRSRDFTWVQSLALMFGSHTLVIAAKPTTIWNSNIDALTLIWDGKQLHLPEDVEAQWNSTPISKTILTPDDASESKRIEKSGEAVIVERLEERNSIKVTVEGLVEMDVRVVPVTKEDDRIHGYNLPMNDAFAHLEMQFKFGELTDEVEGVLGKTYRPGYKNPAKKGVAMPIMGGEDRYLTSSIYAADCAACHFNRHLQASDL